MKRRCTIAIIIALVGIFIAYFFVAYANADSVTQLRTDLKSVEGKVTEIYKYIDFVKKYFIKVLWEYWAFSVSLIGV